MNNDKNKNQSGKVYRFDPEKWQEAFTICSSPLPACPSLKRKELTAELIKSAKGCQPCNAPVC